MDTNRAKALKIGGVCISFYFFNYVIRNVLSVATPNMIKEDFFSAEYIGLLSSVYFIFYAIGQFINGFICDRIHYKFTLTLGMETSCLCLFTVPFFENRAVHFICFAVMGYCLSMIRGTLTKVSAENTDVKYARFICAGFSASCYVGPLGASLLSIFLPWRAVFEVSAAVGAIAAAIDILLLTVLEKKGLISFVPAEKRGIKAVIDVFRLKDYIIFAFISSVGEIIGTAVNFWIPTYMTDYLKMNSETAYSIYSVIAFTGLFSPFITLFVYRKAIHNGKAIAALMYGISMLAFAAMILIRNPYINSGLLLIAKLSAACAVGVVWSIYIPELSGSGMVAGANGVLDSVGYALASLSSLAFSALIGVIGWRGLIAVWTALMLAASVIIIFNCSRKNNGSKTGSKQPVE